MERTYMSFIKVLAIALMGLMMSTEAPAQHIDVKGFRKRAQISDCATIIFKSSIDSLTIISESSDSIYTQKDSEGNSVWTSHIDLRNSAELEHTEKENHRFILRTPYTEDKEIVVPGENIKLRASTYEYQVLLFDYFPLRAFAEINLNLAKYFSVRVGAGKRLSGYLALKTGDWKRGFCPDECEEKVDLSSETYLGMIRNSIMAGIKYGIVSRDYPIYVFMGLGYGEKGAQRSNGLSGKEQVLYYNNYTKGLESELGVSFVLFDIISLSVAADAIFGRKVKFEMNFNVGFSVDLTK